MNPTAFIGAALLVIIGAVATAFFTGVFEDGGGAGGEEDKGRAVSPSDAAGSTSGECRGASCQGKSANDYGCAGDAKVLAHAEKGVYLELKYSPECAAAWGKITQGRVGDVVRIDRGVGKSAQAVITSGYDNHTTMIPAEGDFALEACAEPNDTDGTADWDRFCVKATAADVTGR
ncbi:DUF2690 domain-containing protein [Streptomyces sp. NA04227]|uniref:DUF2690 domain-containing protein n=1 Tax=Streptomyces sp. NA04227 TaxID=2742136 RepID=UPI001591A807|nr:DUF2690 domain-containing protein [Streptomyces sp. NA04227]QKW06719.1 DUF2690 domain-containing protein [Streptomyces sp. NA04227]